MHLSGACVRCCLVIWVSIRQPRQPSSTRSKLIPIILRATVLELVLWSKLPTHSLTTANRQEHFPLQRRKSKFHVVQPRWLRMIHVHFSLSQDYKYLDLFWGWAEQQARIFSIRPFLTLAWRSL